MSKRKRLPVVAVDWVDAAIVQGTWDERKPVIKRGRSFAVSPIHSAGLLLDQTKDSVTLALSRNPNNGDVSMSFVIPRSAIRRMSVWTGE